MTLPSGGELLKQGLVDRRLFDAGAAQFRHKGRVQVKTKIRCFFPGGELDRNPSRRRGNNPQLFRQRFLAVILLDIRQKIECESNRVPLLFQTCDRLIKLQKVRTGYGLASHLLKYLDLDTQQQFVGHAGPHRKLAILQ